MEKKKRMVDDDAGGGEPLLFGFVFAFYTFSRIQRVSMLERVVHMATGADAIHVAIIPVVKPNNGSTALRVDSVAYTSFIGHGVEVQPVAEVLNGCYTFYFMPVRGPDAFDAGLTFLNRLIGAQYNRLSLFTTLLPRRLRRPGTIPRWVSCENREGLMPRADRPAVFCSQMGLMLMHVVDSTQKITIDPAACSPGDLERILIAKQHCIRCPLSSLIVHCDAQRCLL